MPKNTKGGKGAKKGKNKPTNTRRHLIVKDGPEQNYGLITKVLGDLRFTLVDPNAEVFTARLRGKMRGRQRVRLGDVVLFTYRETGEKKVDIIMKYNEDETKRIIRTEGITFPDKDFNQHSSTKGISVIFDDDVEVEEDVPTCAKTSGADRIRALYQDDDDDDDLISDYEVEEDGDEEYSEEEDGTTDDDEYVPTKTAKPDHRKHLRSATRYLDNDGDIDIDAI